MAVAQRMALDREHRLGNLALELLQSVMHSVPAHEPRLIQVLVVPTAGHLDLRRLHGEPRRQLPGLVLMNLGDTRQVLAPQLTMRLLQVLLLVLRRPAH